MEILERLLIVAIFYFILAGILRFLGKREVAKLGIFELVILLIIADIASIGLDKTNLTNFYIYVIPMILITILEKISSFLTLKIPTLRSFIEGKESIIVFNGKINIKEMKKQLYTTNDLISQLRINNISFIKDIKIGILETNGSLSLFKKDDIIPLPIIISGKIQYSNLPYLDIDKEFILSKIKNIKRIELAYLIDKEIVIIDTYNSF